MFNNKTKLKGHGTTVKSKCRNVKHEDRLFANGILVSVSSEKIK